MSAARLETGFFARPVGDVARDLIGCELLVDGVGGVIVETESYHASEPACHGYVGLTPRTAPLFGEPAHAYVYLSYGIHRLLNAVAEPAGVGAAVLIRALEPRWGVDRMHERRGVRNVGELCSGPGKLAQALEVRLELSGTPLWEGPFEWRRGAGRPPAVITGPRVGITKAVDLPWRFSAADNPFVSRPRPGRALVAAPPDG